MSKFIGNYCHEDYGKFYNGKFMILMLYDDGYDAPHFVVVDSKTGGKNFCCRILMRRGSYYPGEDTRLTERQIKSLIKYLFTPIKHRCYGVLSSVTWWSHMVNSWNSMSEYKTTTRVPDYSKLNQRICTMDVIDAFLQDRKPILMENKVVTLGDMEVWLFPKDKGNLPHFHIKDSNSHGKRLHTCIQLRKNNYFLHEGKMKIITDGHKRHLIDLWLSAKPDRYDLHKFLDNYKGKVPNNWYMLCLMWNKTERQQYVDLEKVTKPDYTTIYRER